MMSDLSMITDAVLKKAREEADNLIKEAEDKKNQMIAAAEKEAEKEAQLIKEQALSQVKNIEEVSKLTAKQIVARDLLKKKSELIKGITEDTKNKIYAMDDEEYNELLIRLLNRSAHKDEAGKIAFCEKDRKRINQKVLSEIEKNKLEIESNPEKIKGGFILKYGKIEENCSIEAIFRDENDKICDFLNKELFG